MEQSLKKNTDSKMPAAPQKGIIQAGKALSKLWKESLQKPSFIETVFKFLAHPFVLLGGIIAAIYFLTPWRESRRSGTRRTPSRGRNDTLHAELKTLKKQNKKLKKKIAQLVGRGEGKIISGEKGVARNKFSRGGKATTIYLD